MNAAADQNSSAVPALERHDADMIQKKMDAELRRVLDMTYPGEEARFFLPMPGGSAPDHADRRILSGLKTLTSLPSWE
jgi:hypothetical protein